MKRECGSCTLCCRLVPVQEPHLNKPANTRCPHQRTGKGCAVYHQAEKGFPWVCGAWSCAWLVGLAPELRRPDRSHYVIDIMPDYVTNQDADGTHKIPVVQIWIDPKFPDAHRDPALRAWLNERALVALVRYGNERGILLIPPSRIDGGAAWIEKPTDYQEANHSFAQVMEVMSGAA